MERGSQRIKELKLFLHCIGFIILSYLQLQCNTLSVDIGRAGFRTYKVTDAALLTISGDFQSYRISHGVHKFSPKCRAIPRLTV